MRERLGQAARLVSGVQVLTRWSVKGRWTTKWHVVEPGLAMGEAHSRMVCGMLRQPHFNAARIAVSSWPFKSASMMNHDTLETEIVTPDVCAGCVHEIRRLRDTPEARAYRAARKQRFAA